VIILVILSGLIQEITLLAKGRIEYFNISSITSWSIQHIMVFFVVFCENPLWSGTMRDLKIPLISWSFKGNIYDSQLRHSLLLRDSRHKNAVIIGLISLGVVLVVWNVIYPFFPWFIIIIIIICSIHFSLRWIPSSLLTCCSWKSILISWWKNRETIWHLLIFFFRGTQHCVVWCPQVVLHVHEV